MKPLNKLNQWHQSRLGLFVFGLAELALAYGFVSLSVDRGNLWYYLLTLIFLVGALKNLFKLTGAILNGNKATKTRRS